MRRSTFDGLRHQAELQLHYRETGEHRIDDLPVEDERGFSLMPEPSPGTSGSTSRATRGSTPAHGLEYLTGWIELDERRRAAATTTSGRTTGATEKAAFEQFVDHVVERRRRFPGLHVYHYAAYERTALTRLMGEHATREEEIDDLLRGEVLVDLFRVTKQALRASVPSYSIKDVEKLYGFERTADVGGGGESVNDFERWLEIGEQSLLDGIRDYNREDCVSLFELHRWLLGRRPADLPWRLPPDQRERTRGGRGAGAERDRVRDALLDGAEEGDPDWLLAHLIDYHRREARPQWWAYFYHRGLDEEELLDDGETLGGLELDGEPFRTSSRSCTRSASRRRSTRSAARASIPRPSGATTSRSTTSAGRFTLRGAASTPTSRCRARSSRRRRSRPGCSATPCSASRRRGASTRRSSRSSSGARRARGSTGRSPTRR